MDVGAWSAGFQDCRLGLGDLKCTLNCSKYDVGIKSPPHSIRLECSARRCWPNDSARFRGSELPRKSGGLITDRFTVEKPDVDLEP